MTFARIKEAFASLPADECVFLVLTLDQAGFYSGKPWLDLPEAFGALSKQSRNFLKSLRRHEASEGYTDTASKWVGTIESHKSGMPHMNLLIHAPELARELETARLAKLAAGASARNATLLEGPLLEMAMRAGWGAQSTAEAARSTDALAGYLVKVAGNADATAGELAKLTQVPTRAAQGFRRLRAGVGFLPPKRKNPEYTGTLIRRIPDAARMAYAAVPLVQIKDPAVRAFSELCLAAEEDRMAREYAHSKLMRQFGIGPLPRVEHYVLRDGALSLVTVEPFTHNPVAAPDAHAACAVLPPDRGVVPNAAPLHAEHVQRREYVQLSFHGPEPPD